MISGMTVGQFTATLVAIITGLAAIIKSGDFILGRFKQKLIKGLEDALQPIKDDIRVLNDKIDQVQRQSYNSDLAACKNFMVRFLADVEQGQPIDESEVARFWETYDHYVTDLKQNSYIHEKVSKLKLEGKL